MGNRVVNTYHLPVPTVGAGPRGGSMLVVLCTSPDGRKYAGYMGIIHMPSGVSEADYLRLRAELADRVALDGLKLSADQTRSYFRGLKPGDMM